MTSPSPLFSDGAAYERMMGIWSRIVGTEILRWMAPPTSARWADIGCGNGASTQLIVDLCSPAFVSGIDPSEQQLAYARERIDASKASFEKGDATALPLADDSVDVAMMALVLFFVREPTKGVSEMRRVTRSGGVAAAYCWDIPGGGFPLEDCWDEIRNMGYKPQQPPSSDVSRLDVMRDLWVGTGFHSVDARPFDATRRFASFDDYWETAQASSVGQQVSTFSEEDVEHLKRRVRQRLTIEADGSVVIRARANAVMGRVP